MTASKQFDEQGMSYESNIDTIVVLYSHVPAVVKTSSQ